jgi:hypothetical protein
MEQTAVRTGEWRFLAGMLVQGAWRCKFTLAPFGQFSVYVNAWLRQLFWPAHDFDSLAPAFPRERQVLLYLTS